MEGRLLQEVDLIKNGNTVDFSMHVPTGWYSRERAVESTDDIRLDRPNLATYLRSIKNQC